MRGIAIKNIAIIPSHIFYRFKENVVLSADTDGVMVSSPLFQVSISPIHHCLRTVITTLKERACSMQWIHNTLFGAQEEYVLTTFSRYLSCLMRHQMISIGVGSEDRAIATLMPVSSSFQHNWIELQIDRAYRLSRFAYMRRGEEGMSWLESPLAHARLRLDHALVASVAYQLGTAMTPYELVQKFPEEDVDTVTDLLALLLMGRFITPMTHGDQAGEDDDEALRQWEFHDLLFHCRTRLGRHDYPLGGTYRFFERIAPRPVVKQAQWPLTVLLPRPDEERLRLQDPPLVAVMEARASIRTYGCNAITLEQLGEFLYRVARIKEVSHHEGTGDFTRRPYPDAGASYELEVYLTIDRCVGLAPGFYWYDPLHHALAFIREPDKNTERQLFDADQSMGSSSHPPILLTIAARFQRVSWKYESIAYALILKDVGVMYAMMYLAATAMNLAPCALGAGDSDLFARLAGTDYFEETSVGEFALGQREA